jgi:hypothetical protein
LASGFHASSDFALALFAAAWLTPPLPPAFRRCHFRCFRCAFAISRHCWLSTSFGFHCRHAIIFGISLRLSFFADCFSPPKIVFVDSYYAFHYAFRFHSCYYAIIELIIATLSLLRYYDNIFAIASFIVFHYFRHFACTLPFFAWLFAIIS